MLKRIWLESALAAVALVLGAGLVMVPTPASAGSHVFVNVGVPLCCGPYYYAPPPPVVYYPPAYYGPPVVYAAPPPAPPPPATPIEPQPQTWYYCDNPKGYYPYVSDCSSGWRQVPAHP